MLYLKELNQKDCKEEYAFFQAMPSEHGFVNDYAHTSYEVFRDAIIPYRLQASQGIDLIEGFVPDTYYFLWKHHHIIGLFRIRHYLNAFLENGPGHIGYGILPAYRGKGYASKGLAMAIEKCKMLMQEDEIYLSCAIDHPSSLAVMKKNHGYIHHQDEKAYYVRIPLS